MMPDGPQQIADGRLIPHGTCLFRMPVTLLRGCGKCCWPARRRLPGASAGIEMALPEPDWSPALAAAAPLGPCRSARERRFGLYGGYRGNILTAIPSLRSDCSTLIGTVFTFAGIWTDGANRAQGGSFTLLSELIAWYEQRYDHWVRGTLDFHEELEPHPRSGSKGRKEWRTVHHRALRAAGLRDRDVSLAA